MPRYEGGDDFDLPAPVVHATLRDPATGGVLSDVPLLLHTGADVTLLPQNAIDALGVTPQAETGYELSGFDGATTVSRIVRLELIFLGKTFRRVGSLCPQNTVESSFNLLLDGDDGNSDIVGVMFSDSFSNYFVAAL
jgi:hypothetical protein